MAHAGRVNIDSPGLLSSLFSIPAFSKKESPPMVRNLLATLSAVVLFASFGCTTTSEKSNAAVAADFKLQDLNGKTVKLSDFKGKPVLLDFWATWCQPCRDAIPGIEKLHKAYSDQGLVVLGVSMDQGGWDSVRTFVKERGMTYIILKGTDDVSSDYQVRTIPMLVIIDKTGKVVKRHLGIGGDDELEKDVKAVL
jgi:thiol-disulfide isomerase/thioredoxin